jgi:hypothetical protein
MGGMTRCYTCDGAGELVGYIKEELWRTPKTKTIIFPNKLMPRLRRQGWVTTGEWATVPESVPQEAAAAVARELAMTVTGEILKKLEIDVLDANLIDR